MIEDVVVKELVTHRDERGFFREVIRATDDFFREGFGQWSHSLLYTDVAKAWHIHTFQIDWWYVPVGVLRVALYDARKDSRTFGETMELVMGDHQTPVLLRVPTGVAHGCKVMQGPVHLFYITSKVYNPADEGRIAFDDPKIGYDWLRRPTIK